MAWTSWRSYFSCSGYSSSILTWKYRVGCLLVYFGDFVLVLLAGGISGEGDGVTGFFMLGDGVSCAVCGGLGTVMVSGVVSIICSAGGEVSFSGASRRTIGCTVGDDLVGGGRLAAVGWRGHSPAEGAGCLLLSALFLKIDCVGRFLWKVSSTRT